MLETRCCFKRNCFLSLRMQHSLCPFNQINDGKIPCIVGTNFSDCTFIDLLQFHSRSVHCRAQAFTLFAQCFFGLQGVTYSLKSKHTLDYKSELKVGQFVNELLHQSKKIYQERIERSKRSDWVYFYKCHVSSVRIGPNIRYIPIFIFFRIFQIFLNFLNLTSCLEILWTYIKDASTRYQSFDKQKMI